MWSGTGTDQTSITISKPDIFGGLGREGGIEGIVSFWFGSKTQGLIPYLASTQTNDTAYRGVISIILEDIWLGTNYYFKSWWFRISRIHKQTNGSVQWADAISEPLPKCINPIHVLREVLTNTIWGLSVPENKIGDSFLTAATTCFNEGRGFAWYWNNTGEIDAFIDEIKSHAGCELYQDRKTGLFEIILLRKLTTLTGLLTLNETNVRSVSDFHKAGLGSLISSATVHYTDRTNWDKASVTRINPALVARQGYEVSKTFKFMGCTDENLANTLAEDALARSGYPLISCVIKATAEANVLNPGNAFILDWPDYTSDIGAIVMRVLTINLGTLNDSSVTINAVQDIFSVNTQGLTSVDITGWENPVKAPQAIVKYRQLEIPYYFFARTKGDVEAQKVATDTNYLLSAAVSPTLTSIHADILSTTSSVFKKYNYLNYCCYFELANNIDRFISNFDITNIIDIELLYTGKVLLIGTELVYLQAKTNNSIVVARGVLDTIPQEHSAGTACYALQSFNGSDQVGYFIGETVYTKLLDVTPEGTLDEANAPQLTYNIVGRFHLPYPPANIKINNLYWPSAVNAGTITVTYATRNRIQQTTSVLNGWYEGNITNEPGVTYTAILTKLSNNTSVTVSGASPLTFTSVVAGNYNLTVKSSSSNGDCLTPYFHAFTVI
jgi:hypothetical protein